MKYWFVLGLDREGCELRRLTVAEDRIEQAVELFKEFSDWVEVADPEGKVAPRTAWTRPS